MSGVLDRFRRSSRATPSGRGGAPDWRGVLRLRVRVAATLGLIWACGIGIRLVYLQVVQHDELQTIADRQSNRTVKSAAKRGDIVDRHGRVLAMSADAASIYAVPGEIDKARRDAWIVSTVQTVCAALRDCTPAERKQVIERMGRQPAFALIRRFADRAQEARVRELDLDGIGFLPESRRFYPNGSLVAHVLGGVGAEHNGLGGIEHAYNKLIRGQSGITLVQTDAKGKVFGRIEKPPTVGAALELTVDTYLQYLAEREQRTAVAAHRAAGGTVVITNPRTGEILAMANEPTFDSNEYGQASDAERRNRAVQDLYEPGSTFKIVTASAALQEKVMPAHEPIDVTGGRIKIGSRVVHDDHQYGVLSFTDVIVKSSNVGAIKIGFRLGTDRLSEYVQRYGFGKAASPDFPGESPGIVWDPAKWTDSALASVSMGYQVGVTPLQMVTAVSAVANGGDLMEPRVIGAVYRNQLRYPVPPKVVRRVIDPGTAAALTTIMEGVVERGTAKSARLEGYTVAGKTGTAAKLVDGRYSKQDYNASFVGFVPSRHPALAMIVVIDSPHAGTYYGGTVAAPVFKRIAEGALRYLGVAPTVNPAPTVLVADAARAPGRPPTIRPVATGATSADVVPDVAGMSAREATQVLSRVGLTPRLVGDGFVIAQVPPAGSPIDTGAECRLVLGRLQAGRDQEMVDKP
ncbi:MAG: penicillin-binding protein [Vicinamibacterales bacterium]